MKETEVLPVEEPTHVAAGRRATADLGRRLGLAADLIARAELVAVELAGNILQHAGRGSLYLAPLPSGQGLQILAIDRGPGIGNPERALADGFSTGTTPGLGLGAVNRVVSSLDLFSAPGTGTVAAATLRDETPGHRSESAEAALTRLLDQRTAVLTTRIRGEQVNGDACAIYPSQNRTVFLLVDGLGHGAFASAASTAALAVADAALAVEPELPLAALIQRMHLGMQATRGAAVLLVSIQADQLVCCGVGNISASLHALDGTMRNLVSHNGTVGHRMARVQEFSFTASSGTLLVMHSDGLTTRWKLASYPGITRHAPAALAALLYRDAVRDRDDATVLVARLGPADASKGQGERLVG